MWHKLAAKRTRFVRPAGPWFCQVYQLHAQGWRWEVHHWSDRKGRFHLKKLGVMPTLSGAIAAAGNFVETSRRGLPS